MRIINISRLIVVAVGRGLVALTPARALAHCDGLDGPVVKAAQRAFEARNPALLLIWAQERDEPEIRRAFEQTLAVRALRSQAGVRRPILLRDSGRPASRRANGRRSRALSQRVVISARRFPAADEAVRVGSVEPVRHLLTLAIEERLDVVIGYVETYGRDTEAQLKDLEIVPRRKVAHRGVTLEEMDVDAIIRRHPQICIVDELAHTNVPGSRHDKRYEDVLDILDAGVHVMTAVNIQHLETLNDAVARATGVRVRETIPDTFLDRADEVINVDVTVEELRNRLREGKIYRPEKVEQALSNAMSTFVREHRT